MPGPFWKELLRQDLTLAEELARQGDPMSGFEALKLGQGHIESCVRGATTVEAGFAYEQAMARFSERHGLTGGEVITLTNSPRRTTRPSVERALALCRWSQSLTQDSESLRREALELRRASAELRRGL
jgi:hypothetical protein